MNNPKNETTQKKERTVECVFCIDCSVGMAPHLDAVKRLVKDSIPESLKGWAWGDNIIRGHRAKIITFRNYETDGVDAISESRWFDLLSDDVKQFDTYLNSLQASGGADTNNGLEALFRAMTTDWGACGDYDRQNIILFSNADAVPLDTDAGRPGYPEHMVNMDGLLNTWMGVRPIFVDKENFRLKQRNKRMCLYGPRNSAYENMMAYFNRCPFTPVSGDSGFNDVDVKDVFRVIAV